MDQNILHILMDEDTFTLWEKKESTLQNNAGFFQPMFGSKIGFKIVI